MKEDTAREDLHFRGIKYSIPTVIHDYIFNLNEENDFLRREIIAFKIEDIFRKESLCTRLLVGIKRIFQ